MGWTEQLLTGLVLDLQARGLGVYRVGDEVYLDGEVGIVRGEPTSDPPALIALMPYTSSDHPTQADSVQGIQARTRAADESGDPTQANDLADGVFTAWHGLWGVTINGIRVTRAERTSSLPLGTDDNGRYERSSNFDFHCHRPTINRE